MWAEFQEAFREGRFHIRNLRCFLFSHHPDCQNFGSDVLDFNGFKICKGCTIGYGLALIFTLSFIFIDPVNDLFRSMDPWLLFTAGGLLAATQLIRGLFGMNRSLFKYLQKTFFGTGLFFLICALVISDFSLIVKIVLMAAFLIIGGAVLAFFRPWYLIRTCRKCKWEQDWDRCPGFKIITDRKTGWTKIHQKDNVL